MNLCRSTPTPWAETEPPPPAGWAGRASVAPAGAADGGGPRAGDGLQRKQTDSLPPGAEPSERHLAWFQRMDTQSMGSELPGYRAHKQG